MAGPLNRLPIGILGLFDIRGAGGSYPRALIETIQPTVDSSMFLRGSVMVDGVGVTTPALTAPVSFREFVGLIVPNTEVWFLSEFTVECTLAIDQGVVFRAAWAVDVAVPRPYGLGDYTSAVPHALGSVAQASASFQMPRIMPPGSKLGVNLQSITVGAAGSVQFLGYARILRLTA